MTPEQFVTWLQGFVEGSNAYNLTPAGWDAVKAKLKEVGKFKEWSGMLTTEPLPPYNPQPYYYTPPSLPDEMFKVTCSSTGVSPLKYYNSKGEEVDLASVTTAKPSTVTPTSIYEEALANPKLCQHYDKDGNEITFDQLKRSTPPFEKVDINEDQPFELKRSMKDRWGSCVPELDLKLETTQVEHKVRKFEKDFVLPPIEDEEEDLPYWKYRESLGVSPKPDVTEFYTKHYTNKTNER